MTQSPPIKPYSPKHPVRLVTAASLFDGHDAAINIMRRILQASGAEVIHLGHNRSVQDIVDCAIQEDVQGIAITSYQGGHVEYLKYMYDLLEERAHSRGEARLQSAAWTLQLAHRQAYANARDSVWTQRSSAGSIRFMKNCVRLRQVTRTARPRRA